MDFPASVFQAMDAMTLQKAPKLDFWIPVSPTFTGDEIHSLNKTQPRVNEVHPFR